MINVQNHMEIKLKLKTVSYTGKSAGDDIRVEIKVLGKILRIDKQIKHGSTAEINKEIGTFQIDQLIPETPILLKVTEKDLLFSDVGKIEGILKIDESGPFPQKFEYKVPIQERRKFFWKRTAIFTIKLEAEVNNHSPVKLKEYKSNFGEDYNRFDEIIVDAVEKWNNVFLSQQLPPPLPLDPSLIKAMIYVESIMGYGSYTSYPSYPDVMQVADPRNDAIYALRNTFNPGKNRMGTENEVIDGTIVPLQYPEANADKPESSIYWGVRWLYHRAQENIEENGKLARRWKTWKDAVYRYNAGGDEDYSKKVYDVYERGIDDRGFKLWQVLILMLIGLGLVYGMPDYSTIVSTQKVLGQTVLAHKNAEIFQGYGAAKLSWENYPPTGCSVRSSDWLENRDVFRNCAYTVGANWSEMWTVQFKDGEYRFIPPEPFRNYGDYENVGPYSVSLEDMVEGDLTNDSGEDAVVVLRVNSGGTGHWLNMIVLAQESDGHYDQIANYMFDDREAIRGVSIYNRIITVRVIVKSDNDPQCCPSVYDTYRFKIVD